MRRIGLIVALLIPIFAMPAWAQGFRHDDIVSGPIGHPLSNGTATVCVATATAAPCSPLAPLYTDDTLSAAASNPLQTDGLDNYHFYAAPGRYPMQFSGAGIQDGLALNNVILPNNPSSPTFSSLNPSGGIGAQAMALGGDLRVSGNTVVNGSPTVQGGPVPSTAVANTWTAPQSFTSGPYFRSGSPWFDVKAFCASGSQQQTTGTITGGQSSLALASAIDFSACPSGSGQPGEGVTIYHAGPAPTIAAPTSISVTPVGGNATSTYGYKLVANDYAGGVTAATTAVTISNGVPLGSLSAAIYNNVCFTTSAGAESYTIYRSVSGGAYAYLSTFFDSTPQSIAYCFHDTNYNSNGQTWGTGTSAIPDWGSRTPPTVALDDWCQTKIASGAGTASLTLSATCSNSATGQIVKHDDTPAIQAAADACNTPVGGTIYFPLSGNFNMGKVNWPNTISAGRGWIILNIVGQVTITYPITFGTPVATGHGQSKIRITGSGGGSSNGSNSSQFPTANAGHINSAFVSPVIHTAYQNGTSLSPFVFDHLSIYNRGLGGGDGIVSEGGNSSGLTISDVDVATAGTALKIGYGGIGSGSDGPCTAGGGFGAYVDHSTFTSYFAGDPLTNCDGWTIDITFGLAYFDDITLVGQGIHTMGMGTTDWNHIYEETGQTLGFLTWDTSGGPCNPQCGSNSFRHVELSDPGGTGNTYFINTVNGGANPLGQVDFDSVEGVQSELVGGTTPISSCTINQNGPTSTNTTPGICSVSSGVITGAFTATGGKHGVNIPANLSSGSGLDAFASWNLGPVAGGGVLQIEGTPGYTGDYFDIMDPSSTISSHTTQANIDGNYVAHFYGFQQNTGSTQPDEFGPLGNFVGGTTGEFSASGSNSALGLRVSGTGDPLFIDDTSGTMQSYFDAGGGLHTAKRITSSLATGTAPMTVASTTPVANLTAQYAQTTQFTGTTSGIGGSSLNAGQCSSGTATISGAATSMSVAVSPAKDPGSGFVWEGFVSAANTVTVRVCNVTGGALTPTSSAYNVRIIQ